MKIYDHKGMMIVPDPVKWVKGPRLLVVKSCSCKNGHQLVSERVKFNGYPGILVKAQSDRDNGYLGLSPFYGDKSRVTIDMDIKQGALYRLLCPKCDDPLSSFGQCKCGGNIVAMFTDKPGDFGNCIGICDRADCPEAFIKSNDELLHESAQE